jgi:soluble lytic murein transglycosylase-like protein
LILNRTVVQEPEVEAMPQPAQAPLNDFVQQAMAASKPELSATRIKVIESILTNIATEVFETRAQQEYWVALIGIESRYNGKSKSPAGAIGLGQLMPQYKDDFGKDCGMSPVTKEDLTDDFTNAYLSACFFRSLLNRYNGNIPLALASYNAGAYSVSAKNIKEGGKIAAETESYIRKIWVTKETINKQQKEEK